MTHFDVTRDAIDELIDRWEAIVDGQYWDDPSDTNPLCKLFLPHYNAQAKVACEGCPIAEAGHEGCRHTPVAWPMHKEGRASAQLKFLRRLKADLEADERAEDLRHTLIDIVRTHYRVIA